MVNDTNSNKQQMSRASIATTENDLWKLQSENDNRRRSDGAANGNNSQKSLLLLPNGIGSNGSSRSNSALWLHSAAATEQMGPARRKQIFPFFLFLAQVKKAN